VAQSQPPTPRTGEGKRPPPNQQARPSQPKAEDIRGTQESPAVIRLLPIPKTPEEASQEQAVRDREATSNRRIVWLTGTIATLTFGLVIVGVLQWLTYRDALATNKIVERAYVSMSHVQPGFVFVNNMTGNPHDIHVTVRITNSGHTPADILGYDVRLPFDTALVNDPDWPPPNDESPIACVMPNDHFDVWLNFPIPSEVIDLLADAAIPSYLIGWVIYRDRFGKRHRSGYGRRYIQALVNGGNNLVFITEPGYNYEDDLDEN